MLRSGTGCIKSMGYSSTFQPWQIYACKSRGTLPIHRRGPFYISAGNDPNIYTCLQVNLHGYLAAAARVKFPAVWQWNKPDVPLPAAKSLTFHIFRLFKSSIIPNPVPPAGKYSLRIFLPIQTGLSRSPLFSEALPAGTAFSAGLPPRTFLNGSRL